MVGEIVHIELPSRDFARSATFYAKLFGWKTDGLQSRGHLLFDLPGGAQGSLVRDALAQAPGPVPFVAVADVDKTLAEAEKQGGRILVQRMTLASRGVFGLFADCDGNVVGVLAAKDVAVAKEASKPEAVKPDKPARPAEKPAAKPAEKPAIKKAVSRKR